MKKLLQLKWIVYAVIYLVFILLIFMPVDLGKEKMESDVYLARISEVLSEETSDSYGMEVVTAKYLATVIDKRFKGEIITIEDIYEKSAGYHIRADKGDEVFVYFEYGEDNTILKAYVAKFRMDKQVYLLLGISVLFNFYIPFSY